MKSESRLEKRGRQYESIPVKVVQSIQQSDALAIWTLLLTLPQNWIVRRKWLMSNLNIGRDRLSHAVKRLENLGLWRTEVIRNNNGKLAGRRVIIFYEPNNITQNISPQNATEDTGYRTFENLEHREPPRIKEPDNLHITKSLNITKKTTTQPVAGGVAVDVCDDDGCGGKDKKDVVVSLNFIPHQDRLAVSAILQQLIPTKQADVLAVLKDQMQRSQFDQSQSIRNIPAYTRTIAKRAREGTLSVPTSVMSTESTTVNKELESKIADILDKIKTGKLVLLDGLAATIDCNKWISNKQCCVSIAVAATRKRISFS